MVTSAKRETYMNADVGTVVPEADILAYFVWIPRYKYKLFNATYASNTQTQVIDVTFENGTSTTGTVTCTYASNGAETCTNKSNGKWYTHPAFTLGDTELKGIWVGKFKTTGNATTPTIKPDIAFLKDITIATMYSTGQLFRTTNYLTTNGINQTDSHMMKNIEWGAIAYLKQSNYGLGLTDISINSKGSSYKNNVAQSITGNITGIYDTANGPWEYVMGNYAKTAGKSGLTVSTVSTQYIDIYNGTSVSASHLGDAVGETAGWYNDFVYFVSSYSSWFSRSGNYLEGGLGRGVFSFNSGEGNANSNYSFRVALSVKE